VREGGDPSIQSIMAPIRTSRQGMSAFGGIADVIQGVAECPLLAISGHAIIPLTYGTPANFAGFFKAKVSAACH